MLWLLGSLVGGASLIAIGRQVAARLQRASRRDARSAGPSASAVRQGLISFGLTIWIAAVLGAIIGTALTPLVSEFQHPSFRPASLNVAVFEAGWQMGLGLALYATPLALFNGWRAARPNRPSA